MKSILPLKLDRVYFRSGGETLLEDVTLSIEKGIPRVLLGANGAGKTLLMRIAHGLVKPTRGEVSWAQKAKCEASVRQTMVFQKPIMLRRTVKDNLFFAMTTIERDAKKKNYLVEQALKKINLFHKANIFAPSLSQGEQQKLAIARACLLQPEVLFLDEPTSNIDPYCTREIEELIKEISNRGTQVIMATHNIDQAKRLNGEIIFLDRGKLVEKKPADQFFTTVNDPRIKEFLTYSL